jgi:group I intron endonuclease
VEKMYAYHYGCHAINNAIKEYGKENFKYSIILYCEIDELDYYEIESIKIFHSHYTEHGYNISWGGHSPMRGRKNSEETKEKIRQSNLGRHPSDESRKLMRENHRDEKGEKSSKWGTHPSIETREKMRNAALGEKSYNFGKKSPNASSKYFGVSSHHKKYIIKGRTYDYTYWAARFRVNGRVIEAGQFKIETDAARAYDKYIFENNLPNPLNFPEEYEQK